MQSSTIFDAIEACLVDRVKQLLADPNTDINQKSSRGDTPLVRAVLTADEFEDGDDYRKEALEIVKEILKHPKLDVNMKSGYHQSAALHNANSEETVKLLLAHPKINVNITDRDHGTRLHEAIKYSEYDVTKALLEDPRTDVTIRNGDTAFEQTMSPKIQTLVDKYIENKNRRMAAEVVTMSGTNTRSRSLPQLPLGVSGNISQFLTTTNPKPPKVSEETMRYQERVAREKEAAEQKQQADKDYRAREAMLLGRDSFPTNITTPSSTEFIGNNPRNLGGRKTRRKPISARYSRSVKVRSW